MRNQEKKITVRTQKIKKNHTKSKLIFFLVLAGVLLLIAIFSKYLCPYDPYAQDLLQAKKPPSLAHPFGTDRYGRDLLSRVIAGSTISIFSALILVAVITVIGTIIGILCGWKGGKTDTILMRISDVFLAFPGLVFALAIAGVLGGGIQNAIIALAAISWPKFASAKRCAVYDGCKTVWKQYNKNNCEAFTAKYGRDYPCHSCFGYRDDDDGIGRSVFFGFRCKSSDGRGGKDDQ